MEWLFFLSVTALFVDLLVTASAKAYEVAFTVCPTLGERNDVVNFLHGNVSSFL